MFGLSSSAGVFGAVADMLVAIYERLGFGPIKKWVDDFLVIRLPHQSWTEEEFIGITSVIGVPWSMEKLRRFSPMQRYIGFDWDLEAKMVSLPVEKLQGVLTLISSWTAEGAAFSAHDASSLHGKLVHISCIFKLIQPFLRSISHFTSSFRSARARLHPSPAVLADLSWIMYLLQLLPNKAPLASPVPVDLNWWGDASTSFGIGVVIGSHWAAWKWAPGFRVGPKQRFNIGWAEAVAVELGMRMAISLKVLRSEDPSRSLFLVRSDNSGIVAVTNKGRSRNRETNQILKHVYALQAKSRVRLQAVYVESRANISDALSRGDIHGFLKGFPDVSTRLALRLPEHLRDKLVSA